MCIFMRSFIPTRTLKIIQHRSRRIINAYRRTRDRGSERKRENLRGRTTGYVGRRNPRFLFRCELRISEIITELLCRGHRALLSSSTDDTLFPHIRSFSSLPFFPWTSRYRVREFGFYTRERCKIF